jgi:hypothetical protein
MRDFLASLGDGRAYERMMLSLVLSEVKSLNAVMWLTQLKAIAYGEDDRTSHKSGGEDHP